MLTELYRPRPYSEITRKWYNIDGRLIESRYDLSNGAIFNDLEQTLLPVSRSLYFLTLNISEIVRDADSLIEC